MRGLFFVRRRLTLPTDAEEFQFVRDGLETILRRQFFFEFAGKTFVHFKDDGALRADQMMVMTVVAVSEQFKPCHSIAEVEAFDETHRAEQMHGTIHGRKVAFSRRQRREDLLV